MTKDNIDKLQNNALLLLQNKNYESNCTKFKLPHLKQLNSPSKSNVDTNVDTNVDKKILIEMLSDRLLYLSHPSLSNLECSINLTLKNNIMPQDIFFEQVVQEILSLSNFNLSQIEKKHKTCSILFKDVAAMKLLKIIFSNHKDHPLYPLYLKWIDGSEWMTHY